MFFHTSRDKLEPRALRFVKLGYPRGVKGYELWYYEPGSNKVIISRDVVFNEAEMPFLKLKRVEPEKNETNYTGVEVELLEIDRANKSVTRGTSTLGDHDEPSISSYQLARDRQRRSIHPSASYADPAMISFSLQFPHSINLN